MKFIEDRNEAVYTLAMMRAELGLPKLRNKKLRCLYLTERPDGSIAQCKIVFNAQMIGNRRNQHYCLRCRATILRQGNAVILSVLE